MNRNIAIMLGTAALGIWAMPASAQNANPGQPNDPARGGTTRVQTGTASSTDGSSTPIGGTLGGTLGGDAGGGPKQSKMVPGAAAAGPGGGPAWNVGVQQSSRLGVGGAAGEAGECCKPKELNAASITDGTSISVQQGTRSASAGGAAGNAGECCKPKEINAATLADGSVRSAPPPAQNGARQPARRP